MAAAESLIKRECQVAINWGGGWHHGQRDEASGFCYVNDIVLAIQHLRQEFDRVLYVDLDVHHGDGVENAFSFSPKIFTFSIHKFEAGYFPGSGNIADIGQGKGKFYSLNIPLKDGIDDATYVYIFERCLITLFLLNYFLTICIFYSLFTEIFYAFKPNAIVVQCGADSLANDPLGGFSLSPRGVARCLSKIWSQHLPTLILGKLFDPVTLPQ